MNNRCVQCATNFSAAIRRFVPVVDHVFPGSQKEQVEKHLNQRSNKSLGNLLKKWDSQEHWMLVDSSEEEERSVMLVEEVLHRIANTLPNQNLSKDPESEQTSLE